METPVATVPQVASASRRIIQRLLKIGENRFELLLVELEEERDRVLRALLLALGVAVFGLLAGVALTALILVWLWDRSPVVALLVLTALYGGVSAYLYACLMQLQRDWETLPDTLKQLRKDRECLENTLG